MNQCYIITGGTGFLGGFLAVELLRRGAVLVFLARSKNSISAYDRVAANLRTVEPAINLENIIVLESDTTHQNCGLSDQQIQDLKDNCITGFWHLAASL